MGSAFSTGPSRRWRNSLVPSVFATIPSIRRIEPRIWPKAAIGTWQPPPSSLRNDLSAEIATAEEESFRKRILSSTSSSPFLVSLPNAPRPTAGRESTAELLSVIFFSRANQLTRAKAKMIASRSIFWSFFSRVSKFPRSEISSKSPRK